MVIFGPPFTDDGAYNLICTTLNLVWFWTSLNGKKSGSLCWSWHPPSHGILPMRVATLQVRVAMALPTILPLLVSLSCSVKVCIIQLDHICFEKSSSTFWQVHCCAHRTWSSCQKYDIDFFKFCGLLRKPKLYYDPLICGNISAISPKCYNF